MAVVGDGKLESRASLLFLGAPRIERDGVPMEVDTRKAVALVAYLALTSKRHSRDALAALLWPEYPPGRARAALRRTLSALRFARTDGWLEVDRSSVALAGDIVWVDVRRFRELLAECGAHGHPEADVCLACLPSLSEAVALYRGDFLAGFGLRGSFEFDEWQYFQTESLRRELDGALERLARGHGALGEWETAIAHARRRIPLDPLSEPARRALMQSYALSGQRAAAMRQYRECARLLEKELGVVPLTETSELYQTVKEGASPPPPSFAHATRDSPTREAPEPRPSGSPLVGRNEEWAALMEAYDAASEGRLVILEGEAGIGKTRLAEEFLARAASRGAAVFSARCYAGEVNLAYGPFIEALEHEISRPESAGRLFEVPAHLLAEAARLLPAVSGALPDPPSAPPLEGPGARSRFFEGISRVLLALCGENPGVLFLDDLQWSDDASLDLLTYLARRLRGKPLLILIAWREEEVAADHALRSLSRETRREGVATLLRLERLDREAVAELTRSVIGDTRGLEERLYEETEGLPLFLTEYLTAIAEGDLTTGGEWSLPGGVRDLLRGRLSALGETTVQILGAAAAIGRSFDFDTVHEAAGRGEEEAIAAIEELTGRNLIEEVPDSSGDPLYDFSHEKLRGLIYEETSMARRRLLHRRVASALSGRARRRRDASALAAQTSHHYRLAGEDEQAAEYSKLAGEHARALYANADALSHFQTALTLGHPGIAILHEEIGDLHTVLGGYAAALASYEAAAALLDGQAFATVEHKLGNVHTRQGEWDAAEGHYEVALAALEDESSPGEVSRLQADRSRLAHQRGRNAEAMDLARRALELAEKAEDSRALAQAHNVLGILASKQGDGEAALRHLERSLAFAGDLEDPHARVAALNNLALLRGENGETEAAMGLTENALSLCVSLGDRHREAALHNNLADLLHAAGRNEESMQHLKQAVAIFAEIGEQGTLQPEIWKLVEW